MQRSPVETIGGRVSENPLVARAREKNPDGVPVFV